MIIERAVNIPCDGSIMVGILHEPEQGERDLAVLLLVGGPQYRVGSHRQFVVMAREFAAAGFPVLRFDYRGMGDSEGSARTFEDINGDILAAVDFFMREVSVGGIVLFGLCDAASAAMMYCINRDNRIKGLLLANPWARTEISHARAAIRHHYLRRLFAGSFWNKVFTAEFNWKASAQDLIANLQLLGRKRRDSQVRFVQRMEHGLATFEGRVMLLISGRDLTAREFDDLCPTSKAWVRLMSRPNTTRMDFRDADHTYSKAPHLRQATSEAIKWLRSMQHP